jgi:uncharacterized damage-inducible protein DinB
MKLKHYRKDYNPYFDVYLNNVDMEEECFEKLKGNRNKVARFFEDIKEEKFKFSYSNDKWNIGQILQHIIDTERIFSYRALTIVRESKPEINNYNQDIYAASYKSISKDLLIKDYNNNRNSSMSLFKTFDEDDFNKSSENEKYRFKVGLIPFILCGHELHHLEIIKKKYLINQG